jgi:hypothetical protein
MSTSLENGDGILKWQRHFRSNKNGPAEVDLCLARAQRPKRSSTTGATSVGREASLSKAGGLRSDGTGPVEPTSPVFS